MLWDVSWKLSLKEPFVPFLKVRNVKINFMAYLPRLFPRVERAIFTLVIAVFFLIQIFFRLKIVLYLTDGEYLTELGRDGRPGRVRSMVVIFRVLDRQRLRDEEWLLHLQ